MDVKRYDQWIDPEFDHRCKCEQREAKWGRYVLYDDIKHLLTRPDPMSKEEAEKLVDELLTDDRPYEWKSLSPAYIKIISALTGIPRPDPAEVERLVVKYSTTINESYNTDVAADEDLPTILQDFVADLLKLVGGE